MTDKPPLQEALLHSLPGLLSVPRQVTVVYKIEIIPEWMTEAQVL